MTDVNIKQATEEHPFAPFVRILGKGRRGSRSLTFDEAYHAMGMILRDEVEDVQLGAFLMLLRVKEESAEELAGFVKATKEVFSKGLPESLSVDLDWSSYAGKRRHLPWYLPACFALAQSGIKLFMHGANGHTAGRLYTHDILSDLGLPVANNWQDVKDQLSDNNFSYMPLAVLSPQLHKIIQLRNTLGLRSPVHSLSRLLNPLNSDYVIQGIFHPGYSSSHQKAGQLLGYKNVCVMKGEGGEIERNPDADTKTHIFQGGKLLEFDWKKMHEKRHVKPDSLELKDLVNVWRGTNDDQYAISAVIGTMAIALSLLDADHSQEKALEKARDIWAQRNKSFL